MTDARRRGLATTSWPFVGRGRLLDELTSAARSTGAFLSGAMGVGKSRLLRELTARLDSDEVEVIHVAGAGVAGDIPLAPLLPVLGD